SNSQAEREPFFGLDVERFALGCAFGEPVFGNAGSEQLIAGVKQLHVLDHRPYKMDSGIESSSQSALRLADSDAGHSSGHDYDAGRNQQRRPRQHEQRDGSAPPSGDNSLRRYARNR